MSTDETNEPTETPDDPLAALEATVRDQRERLAAKRAEVEAGLAPSVTATPEPVRPQPPRPQPPRPEPVRRDPVTPDPIAARSVSSPPTDSRPVETPRVEPRATEPPPTGNRPAGSRPPAVRPPEARRVDEKPPAAKSASGPPADAKPEEAWPTPPASRPVAPTPEKARWPVAAESADADEPVGLWRTRLLLGIVALILGFAVGAAGAAYVDRQDDAGSAPPQQDSELALVQTPSLSL